MTTTGFLDIDRVILPKSSALEALSFMALAGQRGVEGVALWAGVRDGNAFRIRRTIIPEQKAGSVEAGLLYVVGGDELHRISLDLFDSGEQLVAQVHSHPRRAYHSSTDDAYPIVTISGGLSVVIPNFARGGLKQSEWAVYRYMPYTGWTALSREAQTKLIQIVDDVPPEAAKPRRSFWSRLWN